MSDAPATKVYYNSACPVCRSGVEAQQGRMTACEIEWIDVNSNPDVVAEVGAELEQVRESAMPMDASMLARMHSRSCGATRPGNVGSVASRRYRCSGARCRPPMTGSHGA